MKAFMDSVEQVIFHDAMAGLGIIAFVLFMASLFAYRVIAGQRLKREIAEMEATLKIEMIQRGMTSDEITSVLGAGFRGPRQRRRFLRREQPAGAAVSAPRTA